MIKMIAMDMDGTLLQSDNTISSRTKVALLKAQQRGIRLVLASGRSYRKLMRYAKELGMDRYGGFLIEVNGIALYDLAHDKREVYHQLERKDTKKIFAALKQFDVEILGMGDDAIYDYIPDCMIPLKIAYRKEHHLSEDTPWTAGAFAFVYDNRAGYPNQMRIQNSDGFPETLNKISVAHYPEQLVKCLPAIKVALAKEYWIGLTSPGWLEIMPKGVTKGAALQNLAEKLHISMAEMMAFGDGENDIEMLSAVGYGVVMQNALDCVKQAGSCICDSNNEDGIAKVLEQIFLDENL